MKITIEINADGAAFEGDDCGLELARIMADLAVRIPRWDREGLVALGTLTLRDVNGNTVGHLAVTGD